MKLLLFPHSHYCEKARWALDYKSISFQPVAILPGFHIVTVRKYAPKTSVPVLLTEDIAVQGSDEIIHYLDARYPYKPLTPQLNEDQVKCLELETWADTDLGQPLRQILYAGLLGYAEFVCDCFAFTMPKYKKFLLKMTYPVVRRKIYQAYVVSDEKVLSAKTKFATALEILEERLSTKEYLVGNGFSRADLTVASLLSLIVMPEEHPFPWQDIKIPDEKTQLFCENYAAHPVADWVRGMYKQHRIAES